MQNNIFHLWGTACTSPRSWMTGGHATCLDTGTFKKSVLASKLQHTSGGMKIFTQQLGRVLYISIYWILPRTQYCNSYHQDCSISSWGSRTKLSFAHWKSWVGGVDPSYIYNYIFHSPIETSLCYLLVAKKMENLIAFQLNVVVTEGSNLWECPSEH